jgi:hypothetical protein
MASFDLYRIFLEDEANVVVENGWCHGVVGRPNARANGLSKHTFSDAPVACFSSLRNFINYNQSICQST